MYGLWKNEGRLEPHELSFGLDILAAFGADVDDALAAFD